MKSVYRVDSEYLTIDEVTVFKETPMDSWLPVMVGDGHYIYKEDYEGAKKALIEAVDDRINELKEFKEKING